MCFQLLFSTAFKAGNEPTEAKTLAEVSKSIMKKSGHTNE